MDKKARSPHVQTPSKSYVPPVQTGKPRAQVREWEERSAHDHLYGTTLSPTSTSWNRTRISSPLGKNIPTKQAPPMTP